MQKLVLKIAKRYLFAKKRTNAINIIAGVAAAGMMAGTLALLLVLSVFNGFEGVVISLYSTFNPDIKIEAANGKTFDADSVMLQNIQQTEGVAEVSQVLEELAILKYKEQRTVALVKGVDANFSAVNRIDTSMREGIFQLEAEGTYFAVPGWGIAHELDINRYNAFENIQVFMPRHDAKASLNPDNIFNVRSIFPNAVFTVQEDFDRKYMFVPLAFARSIMDYSPEQPICSALEIKLLPSANSDAVQKNLQTILSKDFSIKNRFEQDEFLYKVMRTEKWAVYLLLSFILLVASFNIIGSLSMLVIEKAQDIQTLYALGATPNFIKAVFLTEGCLLGLSGGIIGMLLAFVIGSIQQHFGIIKIGGDSLLLDSYPIDMQWSDFLLVFATIIVIALLASYYPAQKAAANFGKNLP